MRDSITVFPDTNVFLHFPPLQDIDWCALTQAKSVKLVVCMTVIHELDAKKADSRLSSRAERAIKEIRDAHKSGSEIRSGVTLSVYDREIRAVDFPDTLSTDSADDRIVHLAKMYQAETPNCQVAIATSDYGMELRAEAGGIDAIAPDPSLRLPDPQDQLTKKYKQAVTELHSVKNRLPELGITVSKAGDQPVGKQPIRFDLAPSWQVLDKQAEVQNQRASYPKRGKRSDSHPLLAAASALHSLIPEEELNRYNQRLENYFLNYEMYVERLNTWGANMDRTVRFDLWLANSGNSPAEDIDVVAIIGPRLRWLAEAESEAAKPLQRPEAPDPPEPPQLRSVFDRPDLGRMLGQIESLPVQLKRMLTERGRSVTSEIWNQGENGFTIHSKVNRLKHKQLVLLGSFYGVFGNWSEVNPFEIEPLQENSWVNFRSGSAPRL